MKLMKNLLGIAAVCLVPFALASVQAQVLPKLPAGVTFVTSVEGISEYGLPNGLHILLFPDTSKGTQTVNLTYKVGSRQESYGETGMAHLLEHMMFKGTPSHSNIPKELNDRGAAFNATTSYDRTNYFETMQASDENLQYMLGLEADRMVNSYVSRKDLDSEMTVVRNEFERGENDPFRSLDSRMMETAYVVQAYGRPVIGFRSDIEGVPIERLQAFYHKYYQPDDAVLTIAGTFDPELALKSAADTFGAIPKPTRLIESSYTLEPPQDGQRSVTVSNVADVPLVGAAYHTPAATDPDSAPLEVLSIILGDMPSGRLYKALVSTGKASSVGSDLAQLHDPGLLKCVVTLNKNSDIAEDIDILQKTMESMGSTPATPDEVDRGRKKLLKSIDLRLSDSSQLGLALSEWIGSGDWRLFFLNRDRIQKVTVADVQRVAAKYLIESNRTTGTFLPAAQTPLRAEVAAPMDPSIVLQGYKGEEAIAQGEAFDRSASNVAKHTKYLEVRKGIKLALIEKKTRGGTVAADLLFHFGNPTNLANTATLGQVAASMLQRGSEKKTRQQIQDTLDGLRAVIHVSYEPGCLEVFVLSTHENLAATLALVAEILRQPSFPASELSLLKQQVITQSEARRHDPDSVASEIVDRTSNPYPPQSPRYVPTIDQLIAAIQAITPEDIRHFYQLANASSSDISIVGDFDSAAVAQTVNRLFGDWQSSSSFVRIPATYFPIPGDRKIVEVADKANATYVGRINLPMSEDDPDYPALLMATQMMGGGSLHSRLADRIRQKDGLSYGVSLRLSAGLIDHVGSLSFYAIFAPQNLGRLEMDIQEEFASAEVTGFNAEELDAARTGWLRNRSISRSQDLYLSGKLSQYTFAGLTFENDVRLEQAVSKVTPEDAARALKKYASPGKFLFVGAGTFDKQPSSASPTPAK